MFSSEAPLSAPSIAFRAKTHVSRGPAADPRRTAAQTAVQEQRMTRMAQADASALRETYREFAAPLFALALRITGSSADADDAIHTGFRQIWQRASGYRSDLGTPFSWMATIVRHKAIDIVRVRTRASGQAGQEHAVLLLVDHGATGSQQLDALERGAAVTAALVRLTSREQHAIRLAFFEDLSHREIATRLAWPVGTVKARIRRAMLKLRGHLAAGDWLKAA